MSGLLAWLFGRQKSSQEAAQEFFTERYRASHRGVHQYTTVIGLGKTLVLHVNRVKMCPAFRLEETPTGTNVAWLYTGGLTKSVEFGAECRDYDAIAFDLDGKPFVERQLFSEDQ